MSAPGSDPATAAGERLPSGNDPGALPRVRALGWNWAAFLMPYPWLLGHGRLTWGMILLLSAGVPVVCFLHLIAYPAAAVYLGRHGYEVAWTHAPYHSVEAMVAGEREWVAWGVVFKVLLVLALVISLLYVLWIVRQPEFLDLYHELLPGS